MFFYALQGATLALAATLIPGPFQAFLVSYALRNGWKRTLPAAFAPLISDGPVIFLVLFVLVKTPKWFLSLLHVAGGSVILYFAWKVFASLKEQSFNIKPASNAARRTLAGAIAMNILNPSPYIFWSVVAGPILLEGWRQAKTLGVSFISGFYGTFVLSLGLFIFMFGTVGRMNPRLNRVLSTISAWALAVFGLYELWSGISKIIVHMRV